MHFPMSSNRMPAFLLWCNKKRAPVAAALLVQIYPNAPCFCEEWRRDLNSLPRISPMLSRRDLLFWRRRRRRRREAEERVFRKPFTQTYRKEGGFCDSMSPNVRECLYRDPPIAHVGGGCSSGTRSLSWPSQHPRQFDTLSNALVLRHIPITHSE